MTAFKLLRYLGTNSQPRDFQQAVNALVDTARKAVQFELLDLNIGGLSLPITEIATEVVTPVYVGINVWETGRDEIAAGLTEFSWQATGANTLEIHTLNGLTAGTDYRLVLLVAGFGTT